MSALVATRLPEYSGMAKVHTRIISNHIRRNPIIVVPFDSAHSDLSTDIALG